MKLAELIRISDACAVRLRVHKDGLIRGSVDYEPQRTALMLERYGDADVTRVRTAGAGLVLDVSVA